jgi:hypothetical protein
MCGRGRVFDSNQINWAVLFLLLMVYSFELVLVHLIIWSSSHIWIFQISCFIFHIAYCILLINPARMNSMCPVMKTFHRTEGFQANQKILSEINFCRLWWCRVMCIWCGMCGRCGRGRVFDSNQLNCAFIFLIFISSSSHVFMFSSCPRSSYHPIMLEYFRFHISYCIFSINEARMNSMHSVMEVFHRTEGYQVSQRFLSGISFGRLWWCVSDVACLACVEQVACSIQIKSTVLSFSCFLIFLFSYFHLFILSSFILASYHPIIFEYLVLHISYFILQISYFIFYISYCILHISYFYILYFIFHIFNNVARMNSMYPIAKMFHRTEGYQPSQIFLREIRFYMLWWCVSGVVYVICVLCVAEVACSIQINSTVILFFLFSSCDFIFLIFILSSCHLFSLSSFILSYLNISYCILHIAYFQ